MVEKETNNVLQYLTALGDKRRALLRIQELIDQNKFYNVVTPGLAIFSIGVNIHYLRHFLANYDLKSAICCFGFSFFSLYKIICLIDLILENVRLLKEKKELKLEISDILKELDEILKETKTEFSDREIFYKYDDLINMMNNERQQLVQKLELI